MTKKDALKILYWLIPIQIGAIFLHYNVDALNKGILFPIGLILIGFIVKSYIDQKENFEFFSKLMEDNRKSYEGIINKLQREQSDSFSQNISKSIDKFSNDFFQYRKLQELQENIDK
jgi:hypothetical protein